ncbi:MAG TPA: flagellar motor stator protein MotA [Bryobacteraceae bacterium]|jgi:chemotaxis protein MotA|nr:flagellar motor stator protein MotA [Bryobacteraceae bacterium]
MLALIGILLVFAAVIGGFLVERGNPYVLMQPAEVLIIGGSALGIVLVSNPPSVIRRMALGVVRAFRPPPCNTQSFVRHLRMLYELFVYSQRAGGVMQLENDIEDPERSRIFSNYPEFLRDRVTRDLVCDSLRMLVIGVTTPQELDRLMDIDIEVQRRCGHEPVNALSSVAEALPGLGIVAAVLGVVITMGALGSAPATIGEKVAAALVGTFLGIVLCYGVVGPLAARLEGVGEMQALFQHVLRIAMVAFARGASPILAIEYARRSIPPELRPTFLDLERAIKRDAVIPAPPKPVEASGAA